MTNRECFELLSVKMDERDEFRKLLAAHVARFGSPPKKYEAAWEALATEKPWRQQPKVIQTIKRAARICAKHEARRAKVLASHQYPKELT